MAATTNAMEVNRPDGDDEAGLGWTWEDIFGPSPANTPEVLEERAVSLEGGMQDDEDTTENIRRREGVEDTLAAMQRDEGAPDGNTVKAEQDAYAQEEEQEDVIVIRFKGPLEKGKSKAKPTAQKNEPQRTLPDRSTLERGSRDSRTLERATLERGTMVNMIMVQSTIV
ncbi:unnamed protein product [Cuscuta epithymum]|uniref:Uncharacterized protein n=1 Tax=Cuscuta epithymum TaxID=186058 RepID=A0AAV0EWD2_9ASTE|nr:unnamed protein product [Cuscuta epithymum]